ncbi:unnamed protein product [Symbiodinium sp. CCMP2456]|nr:unnamed protein product [Symbiodinium sp. CCMP2456]
MSGAHGSGAPWRAPEPRPRPQKPRVPRELLEGASAIAGCARRTLWADGLYLLDDLTFRGLQPDQPLTADIGSAMGTKDAAELLNSFSPEELVEVADQLSPGVLQTLTGRCQQRVLAIQAGNGYGKPNGKVTFGGKGGKGNGFSNGANGGAKAGGKGGKTREKGSVPIPEALEHPEELPATAATGEQVAFQVNAGTPWQFVGESTFFRWELQDRNSVAEQDKTEVREILQAYAEEHGIPLRGPEGIKLALRRGRHWVSYAGGISSVEGR